MGSIVSVHKEGSLHDLDLEVYPSQAVALQAKLRYISIIWVYRSIIIIMHVCVLCMQTSSIVYAPSSGEEAAPLRRLWCWPWWP